MDDLTVAALSPERAPPPPERSLPLGHAVVAAIVALLWGFNFTAAEFGVADLPPLALCGLRFAAIALLLVPFVRRPARAEWTRVAAISLVLGGVHYGLLFTGITRTNASSAVTVHQLSIPFTVLLASIALRERLGPAARLGIVLALSGLALLVGSPASIGQSEGLLLVAGSAAALAAGNVMIRSMGPFDPWMLNGWTALLTAPQMLVASLLLEKGQVAAIGSASSVAWMAFAYTVVGGGVVSFGLWYWLIARHPLSRLAPILLLTPVFGITFGVGVLGDQLTLTLIAGGACLLAGLGISQIELAGTAPNGGDHRSGPRSRR